MGNIISPCYHPNSNTLVKLIFWEGNTRVFNLTGKLLAGEIMFEFPNRMVCHADSFFIGQPIPTLANTDELIAGQTYFVLPRFPCNVLSASSLSALGSNPKRTPINFTTECAFEYVKCSNGRVLIKVLPGFIAKLITRAKELTEGSGVGHSHGLLCSTPELKKHYDQLVGYRGQVWSPKLETILEYKIRFSPCRILRLGWRVGERKSMKGSSCKNR